MRTIAVAVCLLLGANAFAAEKKTTKPELRKGEKVVLALLGMIGSEKPQAVAKAERLLAMQDEKDMLRPLATALTCNPPSLRIFAAGRLARIDDERAARPLLHKLVRERKARVRIAMAAALRRIGSPSSVHVLGRALWSRDFRIVRNAAEALAELGEARARPYLVHRWAQRSGDFPKSYFAEMQQNAYLQDFDVEVS